MTATCPDCDCRAQDHNAVNRLMGPIVGTVAHCGKCGTCWKSLGTPFVDEVRALLAPPGSFTGDKTA